MIDRLLGTPCTITRREQDIVRDDHGNETLVDADPVTASCHVNERNTRQDETPEPNADTTATIYLRPDVAVSEHDLITVGGREWEVDGAPAQRRRSPTGAVHHLEVPVREVR